MTIKDLSAQTGYSVGTISRVLNGQPHVSQKARKIILQAAEESGFQLNANAKQLKQQRGSCVAVVCKGHTNGLFAYLLVDIQSRMEKTKYPLVVDYIDENDNEVRRAIHLCQEKKPLGLLFLGGNWDNFMADFGKIHIPSVLVTGSAEQLPFPNLSSVTSDDTLAAMLAIDHLVEQGHRRIVLIGGDRESASPAGRRYAGCMEAFRRHGIAFDPQRDYQLSRYSFDGGYQAAMALLDQNRDFTALFAMADTIAIGAMRALADAGKRVPEDVSVIGLDGIAIGTFTVPRLTTVAQSVTALSEQSVSLLLQALEQPSRAVHRIVPVSLNVRESVKKIVDGSEEEHTETARDTLPESPGVEAHLPPAASNV